jgi:hypothetical protein
LDRFGGAGETDFAAATVLVVVVAAGRPVIWTVALSPMHPVSASDNASTTTSASRGR